MKLQVIESAQKGFSLIEAMIVIIIIGILTAIAIPAFEAMTINSKLRAYSSSLISSVYLARNEAIKRNASVTLCASTNGSSCSATSDWKDGWIVISGSTVIEYQQALAYGYSIIRSGAAANVIFQPSGVGATSSEFKVCKALPTAGDSEYMVRIGATGRPSKTKTTTGACS